MRVRRLAQSNPISTVGSFDQFPGGAESATQRVDLESNVRRAVGVSSTERSFRKFPDGESATRVRKHVRQNPKLSGLQIDRFAIDGHGLRNQMNGDGAESQKRRALTGHPLLSRFGMLGVPTLSRGECERIGDRAEQVVPIERFRQKNAGIALQPERTLGVL
jgi:hypothetical protein